MKTNNNIPVYRFQGYADDWELRKLGEVATSFDYGLNSAATEYDGENKYLRITDIDDDSRGFNISDLTSPEIDLFGLDEYRLNIGDIVFARTGASVGKSYIYRSIDGKVYFAGFLIRAKIKDNFNPDFVFQNTLTANYERFISITSMRSGQPGVNAQEYSNYEFMVPSHPEQKAIGTFFSTLDQQITLHQRKLDTLKEQKKTYLKLLFPAKGQTKPSLRFQGFEDDWEEVKLGEVCTIQGGNAWKSDSYSLTGEYLVVTIANVTGEYFIDDKKGNRIDINPNEMQYVLKKGDILISLTGNVGRVSKMTESKGVLNQRVGKLTTTANFEFIFSILRTEKFENEMRLASQGAAQANISNKDVLQYMISLPSHPEQEAIGSFFQTLDQEISQVEDKLASLKEMKKTLLRKLFV
ncbi:restriction endonuclease subunit S [Streptococcus suis]|uniref:restriction endonuclease subunit S n=1 Tax=Streptococcus suis TaxID=1307 RepID=UPI000CF731E9|nr:restriction endonuclease subunit S [Streptococcus suis]HEM3543883.1 restriction endonuclease subunit S [Streptococcus suis]